MYKIGPNKFMGGGGVCGRGEKGGAFCSVCIFHNKKMHVYLIFVSVIGRYCGWTAATNFAAMTTSYQFNANDRFQFPWPNLGGHLIFMRFYDSVFQPKMSSDI